MREVDTASPVVWPAWCYSGEGQGEGETSPVGGDQMPGTPVALTLKPGKQRREVVMNGTMDHTTSNNNNNNVKSERLSPATADNNSSSSRSGTPSSSYPGTPPSAPERPVSPSSTAVPHVDHIMSRNYSDFMRSLAAKYNNANPNDYFSSPRNGYPAGMGDPRFSHFKPGAATPFVGLMTPLATTTASTTSPTTVHPIVTTPSTNAAKESPESDVKPHHSSETQQALFANFNLNPFVHPNVPGSVPLFPPVIDMSSTQVLLNMVRTASAQSANQLETYLKGAIKRPPEPSNNPLDLSSNAPPPLKKQRKHAPSLSESLYGDSVLPFLNALQRTTNYRLQSKRTGSVSPKPKTRLTNLPNPTSSLATTSRVPSASPCLSVCSLPGEKPCSSTADTQTVAHWSVEDVCNFITSIDICAEYVPNFREQRIDGSALPLLTEEHLTTALQMKLGPALKLRAVLSRRIGHCSVCLHCVHCHGASSLTSSGGPSPAPSTRPNSTGN